MPSKTRRRLLTRLSTLAALPLLTGFGFARKKNIREFGRVYDYLRDGQLRLKEIDKKRVTIENAEFNGEDFINGYWGYYDFVNCHFPASYIIQLIQTVGCNFIECEFGPSRKDDSIGFGVCRDVLFRRCKFNMANVGFGGPADFEACECVNPDPDPNHRYTLNGGKMLLTKCESTNYSYAADESLVLRDCTMRKGSSKLYSNRKSSADYQLISSTFEDAETILWPSYPKNLTISRCVAKGIFRAQGCEVEGTILLEHLSAGHFDLWGGASSQKLHVKDCQFNAIDEKTRAYFRCIGGYSKETLIERVSAGGLVNLTTATDKTTEKFRYPKAQNDLFIVRGCKIPHLKINWLQSANLRLENCEIGQLEIRDAQIGKLEIVNTKFDRLDLSRTVATEYALDASGEIVDTGSNYDKATGKARKK